MYRPSQTPHPTLSSARIASQNKLLPERRKRRDGPSERESPERPPNLPETGINNITIQCKLRLPAVKILSSSRDSTSNLKNIYSYKDKPLTFAEIQLETTKTS